jgi:ABC-type sugar transport system ATPase subunit
MVVMNDGVVQQVGAPLDVYERPANRFVAGFIGSPAMNFFRATVAADGAGRAVEVDGLRFALPSSAGSAPLGPVALGIRPEDLSRTPRPGQSPLRATVEVVEMVGAEAYLSAAFAGSAVLARVPSHGAPRPGEPVDLYVDPEKLRLFEPAGEGKALS